MQFFKKPRSICLDFSIADKEFKNALELRNSSYQLLNYAVSSCDIDRACYAILEADSAIAGIKKRLEAHKEVSKE